MRFEIGFRSRRGLSIQAHTRAHPEVSAHDERGTDADERALVADEEVQGRLRVRAHHTAVADQVLEGE